MRRIRSARLGLLASLFLLAPGLVKAQPTAPPPVEPSPPPPPVASPPSTTQPVSPAPETAPPSPSPDLATPPLGPLDAPSPSGTTDGLVGSGPAQPAADLQASTPLDPEVDPVGGPKRLVLPSLHGPVGLFRMSTAETGGVGQLRMGFHGEYASADSFLINGDRNRRLAGSLALAFSPTKALEVFTAVLASANRNDRVCMEVGGMTRCVSEPQRVDPPIIRSFGDVVLGTKLAAALSDMWSGGAELGLRLYSSNQGLAFDGDSTSLWFSGLGTMDLRQAAALPLRAHVNLGYYVDNSSNLQDYSRFTRQMLGSKAVSTFAYGIGRSRFRSAVGVDAPLEQIGPHVVLQPFLEYHLEVITAEADPAFAEFMPPLCRGSSPSAPRDARPCSDNPDQHWVTLGLRAQVTGGLAIDAGVDLGIRSPGFPYGSALPPFNLVLGVAFPFDLLASARPKVVTRTVTVEKVVEKEPPPKEGFVEGKVVNALGGAPVVGAIVAVVGQSRSRVATDTDGTFATKGLPEGPVDLEIAAPDFEPQIVKANVLIGQTAQVSANLRPLERTSRVHGRVVDDGGKPILAAVKISGAKDTELTSDASGLFVAELPPGSYLARAEAPPLAPREERFEMVAGVDRTVEITFRKSVLGGAGPAARPAVTFRNNRLVVRRPVSFRVGAGGKPTTELSPAGQQTLDTLAELLTSQPEIRRVRIEAHWDNGLGRPEADQLTNQQAQKIAAYLTSRGVSADRVQAVGMGANKPRVPNLGPASRAKNRRVEFFATK
jgi:hypothetical protein